MIRRAVSLMVARLLAACAGFDPRPQGKVILCERNDTPGTAWFGLALADPMQKRRVRI